MGLVLMQVKIIYFGMIRNALGTKNDNLDISSETTVRSLFEQLATRHGEAFRDHVLEVNASGALSLAPEAVVMLNGRNINTLQSLDTPLTGSAEIQIVVASPAAIGG